MARSVHRSAGTGRFVKSSTVARHPGKTVTQRVPSRGSGTYRSAVSGKFISKAAASRHPNKSIREG